MYILLAAKRRALRHALLLWLQLQDHVVIEAKDGQAVFDHLAKVPAGSFDAVIIDGRIPEGSGLSVPQYLRKLNELKAPPVILYSLDDSVRKYVEALDDMFVGKAEPLVMLSAALSRLERSSTT
ncbi:MAG: response regulator [Minisyncoccia bacterium]